MNNSPQTAHHSTQQWATKVSSSNTVKQSPITLAPPTISKPSLASKKSSAVNKPSTIAQTTSTISLANKFISLQTVTESPVTIEPSIVFSNEVDTEAASSPSEISEDSLPSLAGNSLPDQVLRGPCMLGSDSGQTASAALINQSTEADALDNWSTVPTKIQKSKSASKTANKDV